MELSKFVRFDTVIIVVDFILKGAYFIFTHTIVTTKDATRLFLHCIWKLHSLSNQVVLD